MRAARALVTCTAAARVRFDTMGARDWHTDIMTPRDGDCCGQVVIGELCTCVCVARRVLQAVRASLGRARGERAVGAGAAAWT